MVVVSKDYACAMLVGQELIVTSLQLSQFCSLFVRKIVQTEGYASTDPVFVTRNLVVLIVLTNRLKIIFHVFQTVTVTGSVSTTHAIVTSVGQGQPVKLKSEKINIVMARIARHLLHPIF